MNAEPPTKPVAWYREPMVWLVIALPAVALVAGVLILGYALLHPDVEVHSERRSAPTVTGGLTQRFDTVRLA